jgi:3,4-dihydroxy 2-butanone 4-phosphate synthase/GTP cyclohydrolase II
MIAAEGQGVLLYLRQEGRGIGLPQDHGLSAAGPGQGHRRGQRALGFKADQRDYGVGAQILPSSACTRSGC